MNLIKTNIFDTDVVEYNPVSQLVNQTIQISDLCNLYISWLTAWFVLYLKLSVVVERRLPVFVSLEAIGI